MKATLDSGSRAFPRIRICTDERLVSVEMLLGERKSGGGGINGEGLFVSIIDTNHARTYIASKKVILVYFSGVYGEVHDP